MGVNVFASEPGAVQLVWDRLPAGDTTLEIAGRAFPVGAPPPEWYRLAPPGTSGPGAVVVDGLEPSRDYDVTLVAEGRPRARVAVARTAPPPPGRPLARFATFSDCHVGETHFGAVRRISDPGEEAAGLDPYPLRALRAARREAQDWGAEHLVVRGDITRHGGSAEAVRAAAELGRSGLPVYSVLGNHDVAGRSDLAAVLRREGVAASGPDGPVAVDLPGVRLVLGHTPVPGQHRGRLDRSHLDRLVELAGGTAGPVVLVLHHPPRAGRLPTYYPPPLDAADSRSLVEGVRSANPAAMILSGHTHRTRRYDVAGVAVSEVGSTKDFPGQWAGYTVHEGGIAQTARRIGSPDVIAWTQITGRALGGIWSRWSPGRLRDRCWTYCWPDRRGA
ncbi:MAG TPA: metallophosphoesterase [Acidimicrobiales bacterium]|nr:metallophosphoesterase [Acidimicrobiales bacterium]